MVVKFAKMASLSENINNLRKMVECPVCLEEYKDPRGLPCQHALCSECLGQVMGSHMGRTFPCPACRLDIEKPLHDNVRSFPSAHFVNSLLDGIRSLQVEGDDGGGMILIITFSNFLPIH